jgi:hypothetical protein
LDGESDADSDAEEDTLPQLSVVTTSITPCQHHSAGLIG